jgi:hypothetical protein
LSNSSSATIFFNRVFSFSSAFISDNCDYAKPPAPIVVRRITNTDRTTSRPDVIARRQRKLDLTQQFQDIFVRVTLPDHRVFSSLEKSMAQSYGGKTMLLWEEYRAVHPDGYGYSQFCERYRQWKGRLSPTMRQTHPTGERMFVDHASQTIEFVEGLTGKVYACQLFVAVLGAS